MPGQSHIAELIAKRLREEITDVDRRELDDWLDRSALNRAFFDKHTREAEILTGLRSGAELDQAEIWNTFQHRRDQYLLSQEHRKIIRRKISYAAAAVVIGLLGIGIYYLPLLHKKEPLPVAVEPLVQENPSAPMNKATLTLDDGTVMPVNGEKGSIIAVERNWQAAIQDSDILAYQPGTTVPDLAQLLAGWDGKGQPHGNPWQPMRTAYNILTVPKGKRQQIELPDHTKIILNAGSSLRYPVTIGGDRRMVELRGEAYFDVAADPSRPFVVKTADQEIKVLGTRFVVRNYPNEPQQSTILEDGKVSVAGSKGAVVLQPGQEVLMSAEDGMHVRSGINVTNALSWKAGYFNFDGLDIRAAVWRIAQWYGMQVYFEKGVKRGTLGSGDIQDGLPLGRLLEDLELPDLHFEIKNDTIIVKR